MNNRIVYQITGQSVRYENLEGKDSHLEWHRKEWAGVNWTLGQWDYWTWKILWQQNTLSDFYIEE